MIDAVRRNLLLFSLAGAAIAAPLAWQYFWPADALRDVSTYPYGRDFINVWGGARLAFGGDLMTLFDFKEYFYALERLYGAEIPFHAWSYPPHILPLIAPFSLLAYWPALAVWTALGFALYAFTVLARLTPGGRGWGLLLLLIAPATMVNTVTGQNGFYTAALFLGAVAFLDRRPWLAGVLLGLLTVKPHLGILIAPALLAIGAWRTIAAAVATAALLMLATVVLWGVDPWIGFATKTTLITRYYFDHFQGFYTYMMPSVFASALLVGLPQPAAFVVQGVVTLGVIGATVVAIRRTSDVPLRALLLASGTLLASPYAFNYDMTIVTGAALWCLAAMTSVTDRERWMFGVLWILPVLIWPLHLYRIGVAPFLIGTVFVWTAVRILRGARTEAGPPGLPATPRLGALSG